MICKKCLFKVSEGDFTVRGSLFTGGASEHVNVLECSVHSFDFSLFIYFQTNDEQPAGDETEEVADHKVTGVSCLTFVCQA